MQQSTPLRLVVITMSTGLPDPGDEFDWNEATRLRDLLRGLEGGGHRIEAVLPPMPPCRNAWRRSAPTW